MLQCGVMRIKLTGLFAVLLATTAHGGVVEFHEVNLKDEQLAETWLYYEVSIASLDSLSSFNTFGAVIGSDDLNLFFFYLSGDIPCEQIKCHYWAQSTGIYPSDFLASFNGNALNGESYEFSAPLILGWVSILRENLVPGNYTILVDGERDGGISSVGNANNERELLFGSTVVTIVPEPSSLTLLFYGVATVMLRRRNLKSIM